MKNSQNVKHLIFNAMYNNLKTILGITQDQELAKKLGLTPQAFSNQKNRATIPIAALLELCRNTGISLDEVFGLKPTQQFPCKCRSDSDFVRFHLDLARKILSESSEGLRGALSANIIQFAELQQLKDRVAQLEREAEENSGNNNPSSRVRADPKAV